MKIIDVYLEYKLNNPSHASRTQLYLPYNYPSLNKCLLVKGLLEVCENRYLTVFFSEISSDIK